MVIGGVPTPWCPVVGAGPSMLPPGTCCLFKYVILEKSPIISEDDNSIAFLRHCIKPLPSYVLGTDEKNLGNEKCFPNENHLLFETRRLF